MKYCLKVKMYVRTGRDASHQVEEAMKVLLLKGAF